MQSEESRIQFAALMWTIMLCLLLECFSAFIFALHEGSFLAGLFFSVWYLGPLSLWMGPKLYRYICSNG
jgi:hypothetical protein